MKVRMLMDWWKFKKGEVVTCSDQDGCRMINTGVASVEELDKPAKTESRQDPLDHEPPVDLHEEGEPAKEA